MDFLLRKEWAPSRAAHAAGALLDAARALHTAPPDARPPGVGHDGGAAVRAVATALSAGRRLPDALDEAVRGAFAPHPMYARSLCALGEALLCAAPLGRCGRGRAAEVLGQPVPAAASAAVADAHVKRVLEEVAAGLGAGLQGPPGLAAKVLFAAAVKYGGKAAAPGPAVAAAAERLGDVALVKSATTLLPRDLKAASEEYKTAEKATTDALAVKRARATRAPLDDLRVKCRLTSVDGQAPSAKIPRKLGDSILSKVQAAAVAVAQSLLADAAADAAAGDGVPPAAAEGGGGGGGLGWHAMGTRGTRIACQRVL